MPSIQVTGQLVDPTTGVEGSADIRIASLINYSQTTKKSISHKSTDASGNYDFQLVYGKHLIFVKYEDERIYIPIGYAVVGDSTPDPIDIIQLINLSDENPPSELVTELQQLREDTLNDIVDTSAQVLENAGYQGEWVSGTSTALKGETWQVNGRYYVALKNTSVDPINDDENWREDVTTDYVTTAQNDIVGGSIFKGSNGEYVQDGDTAPSGTTHLRVLVGGEPTIVEMVPIASGVVSLLTETSATVGGVNVEFIKERNKPSSISQAKKIDYKIGELVETQSYYSKTEVSAFNLESPQGGGARYIVVSSSGLTEDTVKYHALDNGNFLELLDVPNSRNAGLVANYISPENTGFDNLSKAMALDALNSNLKNNNRFHGGSFYFSAPDMILSCDSKGEGKYVTKFFFEPSDTAKECCIIKQGVVARDISFYPARTNQVKQFIPNKFSELFVESFNYHDKLFGPRLEGETAIIDIGSREMARGLRGTAGTKNVTVVRGDFWGGDWGTSFYDVELLSFDGSKIYGGTVGGLGLPSCRHVSIGGGLIVYNPNGTGINDGGSRAEGFNAEDINIGRCTVYARDCINLENGCISATVSGYKIYVITELPQNGVAIGVFSRELDNGGHVGNIEIGPGKIEGNGQGSYSHAVKVGFSGNSKNAQPLRDITVFGVSAVGCRVGCESVAPSNSSTIGFKAGGNSFDSSLYGYALTGEHTDGSIDGGDCTYSGDTTISGTYGARFGILRRFILNGIKMQGYNTHYRQDGAVQEAWINNPIGVRGKDLANFIELDNQSGSGPIPIHRTAL